MDRDPAVDLRQVDLDELFGELRRRNVADYEIRAALNLSSLSLEAIRPMQQRDIRQIALLVLSVISIILVVIIGMLALTDKTIPDLLSGLAGSGIGAIAGILSGAGHAATSEIPPQRPPSNDT